MTAGATGAAPVFGCFCQWLLPLCLPLSSRRSPPCSTPALPTQPAYLRPAFPLPQGRGGAAQLPIRRQGATAIHPPQAPHHRQSVHRQLGMLLGGLKQHLGALQAAGSGAATASAVPAISPLLFRRYLRSGTLPAAAPTPGPHPLPAARHLQDHQRQGRQGNQQHRPAAAPGRGAPAVPPAAGFHVPSPEQHIMPGNCPAQAHVRPRRMHAAGASGWREVCV